MGFLNAKKRPLVAHESVLVFSDVPHTYNPQKTTGHPRRVSSRATTGTLCYNGANKVSTYDSTERYPRSVQKFSSDKRKTRLHPTQKPVQLMRYLVNTYTNKDDVVLDFAMGSGTTGVAAADLGRSFIGIENSEKYYLQAQRRIQEWLEAT
jgi:site-specific DNA-methyltransferase (adenine-specific)